jgi:hypothetical protein
MASKSKKIKDFQVDLLSFLKTKHATEVYIYYHVMNYWSNDPSMISLPDLKCGITDLCERNMITSKNNAHLSIGMPGVSEEDQKNNTLCTIQQEGVKYIERVELMRTIQNILIVTFVVLSLILLWYYKHMIIYFFR